MGQRLSFHTNAVAAGRLLPSLPAEKLKTAPSLMPDGQRAVTVFRRVWRTPPSRGSNGRRTSRPSSRRSCDRRPAPDRHIHADHADMIEVAKSRAASPSRVKMAVPLPYSWSITSWRASSSFADAAPKHRPENLVAIDRHVGGHPVEKRAADEEAVLVPCSFSPRPSTTTSAPSFSPWSYSPRSAPWIRR